MKKWITFIIYTVLILLLANSSQVYSWSVAGWDSLRKALGATSNSIIPGSDDTYDLGSSNLQFKDLYIDGVVYIDAVGETLSPSSDDSYDLGASGAQWKDLYIDGLIYADGFGEGTTFADDLVLGIGTGNMASFKWDTNSTNDDICLLTFIESDGTDIPLLIVSDTSFNPNGDATFDNITEPAIAFIDDDADSYFRIGYMADDQPGIETDGDIFRIYSSVRINDNKYFQIGGSADMTMSWNLNSTNDDIGMWVFGESDGTNIPILVFSDSSWAPNGDDLFDNITEPTIAIMDDAATDNFHTLIQAKMIAWGTATESFTTEANITNPLPGIVVLLSGDDDGDNDAIDLQNGTKAGQMVILIASANIDADDTCTINMADTTCTNCPAIAFDTVGESATLVWTGSTWVVTVPRTDY